MGKHSADGSPENQTYTNEMLDPKLRAVSMDFDGTMLVHSLTNSMDSEKYNETVTFVKMGKTVRNGCVNLSLMFSLSIKVTPAK